jgi:hypothetical protein
MATKKVSVAIKRGTNFFNHHKIGDQNPFSVAICIKGSPNVNKYFPMASGHDGYIKLDIDVTHEAKWPYHVSFDNSTNKR